MAKDYTKYEFNGKTYTKGRLVFAVVAEWIKEKKPTLEELFNTFPNHLQGSRGVLLTKQDYAAKRENVDDRYERFFYKDEDILKVGDSEILVCSQWGRGNIPKFIEYAKSIGFEITSVESEIDDMDIIQEFTHKKDFADNYKGWPKGVLRSFCSLMKVANENNLDIFTTNMSNGGSIRVGRKDMAHNIAIEVFATLEPRKQKLIIEQRFQHRENPLKSELNEVVAEQLIQSGDLQQFANKFPISRQANWPSDYPDTDKDSESQTINIWKVSHSPSRLKDAEIDWLAENRLLAVHKDTGNGSVPCFEKIKEGDIVSLGYGNKVGKLVRVLSPIKEVQDSLMGDEWLYRNYEPIKSLERPVKYNGKYKRWSPRFNGTCWYVPAHENFMFQQEILIPYYQMTLADLGIETDQINSSNNGSQNSMGDCETSLNQILYGPPGTGKTYRSVILAVEAAEPGFIASGKNKNEIRKSYKLKFEELVSEGRIRFVTFHQSYGYEEFVEGLSAKTEGDQLSYFEKDGIFKSICSAAKAHMGNNTLEKNKDFDEIWQIFSSALAEETSGIQITTLSKKSYFTITDVTDTTIRFDKSQGSSIHTLSVNTLKAIYNGERNLAGGLQPYYGALVTHLKSTYGMISATSRSERKNYVLVIDEINRGNISKIFGELITLIEPSKRLGSEECLSVSLPYSGDSFSVPDNLFIIGTMNTADRSLALMDTALRRRFDFIEMMPDYSSLCDEAGNSFNLNYDNLNINLAQLLETLNSRIAALYDREHTLGHAFLMPVIEHIQLNSHDVALGKLADIFKNKIIPLLAEYFFEDWQKIRLIIGDNQKDQKGAEANTLIRRTPVEFDKLFGDQDDMGFNDETYTYLLADLNDDVWQDPLTYIGMYDLNRLSRQ